jgi:hypothetical protein
MSTIAMALGLGLATHVAAYNSCHGPFEEGTVNQRILLEAMQLQEDSRDGNTQGEGIFWFAATNAASTRLIACCEEDGFHVELKEGGKILFPKSRVSDFTFAAGLHAFSADLNGDGTCDFLFHNYSGGSGLASGYCDVTFLLSDRGGYSHTTVTTLWPDPGNYLVLGGKPCFIHTEFSSVEKCKDGKEHGFWVYSILSVEGAALRLNNHLVPGFPKTVWYTHKPNHRETTLLTERQKAELIKQAQSEIFPPPDK